MNMAESAQHENMLSAMRSGGQAAQKAAYERGRLAGIEAAAVKLDSIKMPTCARIVRALAQQPGSPEGGE